MDLKRELDKFYYSAALCDLRLMNKKFLDQNITYNSFLYLELIYTMEGRCTASKIAELLYISKPAVTLKVNELIKLGLVTKTPAPRDHRQNLLSVNKDAIPSIAITVSRMPKPCRRHKTSSPPRRSKSSVRCSASFPMSALARSKHRSESCYAV